METVKLKNALRYIRSEIGDLPVQQLELFLEVAEDEGVSQADLIIRIGMLQGTTSRNIRRLSHKMVQNVKGEYKNIGYGLIESRLTGEGRRESLHLTPKGRALYKDLNTILKK